MTYIWILNRLLLIGLIESCWELGACLTRSRQFRVYRSLPWVGDRLLTLGQTLTELGVRLSNELGSDRLGVLGSSGLRFRIGLERRGCLLRGATCLWSLLLLVINWLLAHWRYGHIRGHDAACHVLLLVLLQLLLLLLEVHEVLLRIWLIGVHGGLLMMSHHLFLGVLLLTQV